MTTGWTDNPATAQTRIQALLLNEVRAAIEAAGYSPGWTDGSRLDADDPIRAKHVTELRDAIQNRWNTRGLGLIPNWSSGHEPGGTSTGAQETPVLFSDINDVRRWFNHFETWGDLRGVHWFNATQTDLPKVGWNIETVIGVSNSDNSYNATAVGEAKTRCNAAWNYGLVNIVRLDCKPHLAVPLVKSADPFSEYQRWIANVSQAVYELRTCATIFVIGNEPNHIDEGNVSSGLYAQAFNDLYQLKASGISYIAAGPAPWYPPTGSTQPENDLDWLTSIASNIADIDGFALHTYHSIGTCPSNNPGSICSLVRPGLIGDGGFQRFRDFITRLIIANVSWISVPIYITEPNTKGFEVKKTQAKTIPEALFRILIQLLGYITLKIIPRQVTQE